MHYTGQEMMQTRIKEWPFLLDQSIGKMYHH
jgi:hypothetical protein